MSLVRRAARKAKRVYNHARWLSHQRNHLYETDDGSRQWHRIMMNKDVDAWMERVAPTSEAVEVSGHLRGHLPWKSYTVLDFPAFDLTAPPATLPGPFDVVICEQVLEHVPDPVTAVRTLAALCKPGGTVHVSTPFLVRPHQMPLDFYRYLPSTLGRLLEEAGLKPEVHSWGNRPAVIAGLWGYVRYWPFMPLRNDDRFPIVVWAYARKPGSVSS